MERPKPAEESFQTSSHLAEQGKDAAFSLSHFLHSFKAICRHFRYFLGHSTYVSGGDFKYLTQIFDLYKVEINRVWLLNSCTGPPRVYIKMSLGAA